MRRAAKVDSNHGDVRDHLLGHGWSVHSTAPLGRDFPDLLASRAGFTGLVEVKDGAKPASKRKLSDGQQRFRDTWQGVVITALSGEHALAQLEAWRAKLMRESPAPAAG